MSINMMNYITDKTYHTDKYNSAVLDSDDSNPDISNYFDLKNAYFSFLNKNNGKDTNKQSRYTIYNSSDNGGDITTNYPIQFTEGVDKYILEIINDDTRDIIYKKSISVKSCINVKERISTLTKKLIDNNYILQKWELFNKVESIRKTTLQTEALIENNYISKDVGDIIQSNITTDTEAIRKIHRQLKSELADFNIELNVLHKLLYERDVYKLQKYSSYNIDLLKSDSDAKKIYDDIHSSVMSRRILLDGLDVDTSSEDHGLLTTSKIRQYKIIHQFIDQSNIIQKGCLVLYDSSIGQTLSETEDEATVSTLQYAKILSDIDNDMTPSTNINIRVINIGTGDLESPVIVTQLKNLQKIVGIYSLLKNTLDNKAEYTIPYDEYRSIMLENGITYLPEYHRHVDIDISKDGDNYIKKTHVNYFYNTTKTRPKSSNTKRVIKKTKTKVVPAIQSLDINIIAKKDLYNERGDVFMFYSKSSNSSPGKGVVEMKNTDLSYDDLKSFKDWRKKLSNFWINRDETTGNIIPIIIDGVAFASVEHYFHYRKHWEVPSFDEDKRKQHSQHALKFTLSYKGSDGYGKSEGNIVKAAGRKLDSLREDWFKPVPNISHETKGSDMYRGDGSIKLRDYILLKGNYAKFTQHSDLRELLLSTLDSKLVHPLGGSPRTCKGKYEIAFPQIFTRMLLRKQKPLLLYKLSNDIVHLENGIKGIVENEYATTSHSTITINSLLNTLESQLGFSVRFKKKFIRRVALNLYNPPPTDPISPTADESPVMPTETVSPTADISPTSGVPNVILPHPPTPPLPPSASPIGSIVKLPESEEDPISSTPSDKSEVVSVEEQKGIADAIKQSVDDKEELAREIETLHGIISKLGKAMYEVPPDGDCGYYAIVEMMARNNIFPLNFSDGVQPSQYSDTRQSMDTSITQENRYMDILHDAMLEARRDIATKFNRNIFSDKIQSDELELIKTSIAIDAGSESYSKDIHDKKMTDIIYSHNKKPQGGDWISTTELGLASALYNVNITVQNSYGTVDVYNADKYKEIYPNSPNMNTDKPTGNIHLGYYSKLHYIGIIDSKDAESIQSATLEKITYYTILIELPSGNTYNLILDIHKKPESSEYLIIPLGIFNVLSKTIDYFSYKTNSLHREIVEEYSKLYSETSPEYILNTPALFEPVYYYKDITSHSVYLSATISDKPIGSIIQKQQKDGSVYQKIEFLLD